MIEKQYAYTLTDSKTIERIISDGNADINHMVLGNGEALPIHHANSNVYMLIIRGGITLRLDEQEAHTYHAGSIVNIPNGTLMNATNEEDSVMEMFVVKAPSPKA